MHYTDVYKRQVQLRDGYRQNRRGQVFYYDQNGVLNANGKQDPKPDNNNNVSGRNQFVQIGNNVWAYYDGNGKRVTGHQNINGQELFFDNNGVQVKGRTVNAVSYTHLVRKYFSVNECLNQCERISQHISVDERLNQC